MFGGGGFGQQNNNQQQGGGLFGGGGTGFGATTTPAFGAPAAAPAFGQPQQAQQQTGFGGFGAAPSTTFGAAPATPAFGGGGTGGGLFGGGGNNTAAPNSGFTFGGGGNNAFGASTAQPAAQTGGLFGAKPATSTFGFGAQAPATGGGLFGGGGTAFGAQAPGTGQGTGGTPYATTLVMEPPKEEGKPDPPNQTPNNYHSISSMPAYKNYSFEELRYQDYQANRKQPSATTPSAFGASTFGNNTGFGATNTTTTTTTPSLFGNPAPTNTFGQPANTGAFGQTPAKPSLFGGTTTAFGAPSTSAPSLFGATNTTTTPATGGGLFGGGGTTGGFGQPQQPAPTTFGGFGAAANKPAGTGFTFGAASTAPATGGLFGQTQPAQQPQQSNPFGQTTTPAATGGGLFGQAAAPAAGGFSFGATANKPSLFGNTQTAAPAFGATPAPAKSTFSFGATPATTGGGLFGQPQQQQAPQATGFGAPAAGGGLFGNSNPSPFGQTTPAAGAPSFGGGGLFGSKPAAPAGGGLFGAPAPAQQQPGASSFGGFGSFGASTPQAAPPTQTVYATADDPLAFGSNPLFANSTPASSRPVEEKKRPPIFTAFKGTPVNRSSTKITRLRGFGNTSTPGSNHSPLAFSTSSSGAPGTPVSNGRASPLRLANGIGDEVALSPNAFVTRPGVKKLVINSASSVNKSLDLGKSSATTDANAPPKSTISPASGPRKVTWNPETDHSTRQDITFEESSTPVKKSAGSNANLGEIEVPLPRRAATVTTTAPTSAALKHGAYWSSPPIEELRKLPAAALSAVADLVVGRVGYGEVAFDKPVDLTALDSVEDLYGVVVSFEDRNAVVEPPLKGGATISLEKCFPLDKSTRKPITDPSHPRYIAHVKRLQRMDGVKFISFDNGTWVFSVDRF